MFKTSAIVFILFLLVASFTQLNAQSLLQNGKIPDDLKIRLERWPCYGDCPEYHLTIAANGKVVFNGDDSEDSIEDGEDNTAQISKAKLLKLVRYFETIGFGKMRNRYALLKDGCGRSVSDLPSLTISITANRRTKKIYYDFGCTKIKGNADAKLAKLGRMIDLYANSSKWLSPVESESSEEDTEPIN